MPDCTITAGVQSTLPHALEALLANIEWLLAPLIAIGVSVVYFLMSPRTEPLGRRLLASTHGVSIAALYFGALWIGTSGRGSASLESPFLVMAAVPLAPMIAAFFLFRGRKAVHLLQVLNLACLVWTLFVGTMAVTDNWL